MHILAQGHCVDLSSRTYRFSGLVGALGGGLSTLSGYNGLPSVLSGLDDSLSDVAARKKYPFELEKAIHNVMFIQHHMQRQDEFNAVSPAADWIFNWKFRLSTGVAGEEEPQKSHWPMMLSSYPEAFVQPNWSYGLGTGHPLSDLLEGSWFSFFFLFADLFKLLPYLHLKTRPGKSTFNCFCSIDWQLANRATSSLHQRGLGSAKRFNQTPNVLCCAIVCGGVWLPWVFPTAPFVLCFWPFWAIYFFRALLCWRCDFALWLITELMSGISRLSEVLNESQSLKVWA